MSFDVEALLAELDLDAKASLLAGQDVWSLPALPRIGLASMVLSDGPVGVRGKRWSPEDPSVTLPSPTALAASWDPRLAVRAGRLLAQEARRKGVHVLLAPTINLQRSPLGGRHFECYSEDPLLTGMIGAGYVTGVQDGGVAVTVKHFVANDFETERFTVDVRVRERALRELYLAPFELIVRRAKPWGIMAAYNCVNGVTMTQHAELLNGVLRDEWGFDGFVVSDWLAARDTVASANGGLDVAMPGPRTVFGERLAEAVRGGEVDEAVVDAMVRRVLLLADRTGALGGSSAPKGSDVDGDAIAREVAHRSFVLLRNETGVLPLREPQSIALIGALAADPKILGGGSATVFPDHIVSPLDGLKAAIPPGTELGYAPGADPRTTLPTATDISWGPRVAKPPTWGEAPDVTDNFRLRATARAADGAELAEFSLRQARIDWIGELPAGLDIGALASVEIAGTFLPEQSGTHTFGVTGPGDLRLTVAGQTVFDGVNLPEGGDIFTSIMQVHEQRRELELTAGEPVDISLTYWIPSEMAEFARGTFAWVTFALGHRGPVLDPDASLDEAVALAAKSEVAIVVVGTTAEVESEGFDRTSLALPGRQDELVARVAEANRNTVVVVNAGSPVEMPWRDDVAAVLLTWFPGQAGGAALADVLLGREEPGGRLPTTWPAKLEDAPVTDVTPEDGVLEYGEDVYIGYGAWARAGRQPAYWFGHGQGYTTWAYQELDAYPDEEGGARVRVRVRNTGTRTGREVVQLYLAPTERGDRPQRWLAGFASVEARPGQAVDTDIVIAPRSAEVWRDGWQHIAGEYVLEASHSYAEPRLSTRVVLQKIR
ncbi:beta-glucosidase [Amycolatopsis mediterranei S699]|uniref:Beta-glucosidase n=2 Tax=Amycolatopsis mediterranei TaxID=33910 RepID=A0A0H3DKS1_AMYMU|nr:glycoside hydrolase family 3 C-terminal domain-containing protein [Amycolatopsis mediterranei]ADJ50309.1 beta-glucosidase [Amycolatopsis mediterranei U32]AEK47309.1 beta-glucosidase [Amycolatopsis mediterranei S699]AFO82015.1 beta-glucosidase [Amycolatopsis mediterranei S699]AGT89144.1 beta-glucosidase [Amycolatopsis mediterranei RB]KDO08306.1 beta-glucosidase [Amycolatopsis mediterranei]